jgi:hypothetical protein
MTYFSTESKSFIILIILIVLASWGSIKLTQQYRNDRLPEVPIHQAVEPTGVSTLDWHSYVDPVYPLVFKYPKGWTVQEIKAEPDFYVIALTPKNSDAEMRVYINNFDYFALNGLPSKPRRVGNEPGLGYGETLASAKVGKYFYTFDGGLDTSLVPEFQSLLNTVEFR